MDTKFLDEILDGILAGARSDHDKETAMRGHNYAVRRVMLGMATTEAEAKLAFAAFADGFCTGFSVGSGKLCPHTNPLA